MFTLPTTYYLFTVCQKTVRDRVLYIEAMTTQLKRLTDRASYICMHNTNRTRTKWTLFRL